jgi:hypothetical protein
MSEEMQKVNDVCGEMIAARKSFIWVMYRDQGKWTILA